MNYHRVLIQLLTIAISISDKNGDKLSEDIYENAHKALNFLYQCQDEVSGWMPNYGSNDGALFFPLSNADYRDYRPQLDVLKQAQIESDTQDYVEVLTLDSDTQDMEKILAMLEPELEVQTEDGYQGVLSLDHTTITVEAAGYKSSSRTVSATRTYPNLSGADVSLIPKSITDSGRTLTLADVQWQEAATTQTDGYDMALRYTATATYTGTATSKYATGYVVTANYVGEVTRVSTDVITYTAVFSSGDSASAGKDTDAAIDTTQSAPFSFDWKWLLIPLGLGALGCAGYFGQKGYKHYINKKRGYE